jgi:hypothetical protein
MSGRAVHNQSELRRRVTRGLQALTLAAACAAPLTAHAQELKISDLDIPVHFFGSQGFIETNHNNVLTMDTSQGSAAFSDAGVNVAKQFTPKFRAGIQVYTRNVGNLGDWRPQVDWAYGDYHFNKWLGVRGGKVKTTLGLYNDTQDVDFLHTWAVLPNATYPIDLRDETIAHVGADVYGAPSLNKLGSLAYTAYAGKRPTDMHGGFVYGLKSRGTTIDSIDASTWGGDLRWNAPLNGLMLGTSFASLDVSANGTSISSRTGLTRPYVLRTKINETTAYYGEYQIGSLRLDAEHRGTWRVTESATSESSADERGWFYSAAYRLAPWIEVGAYRSIWIRDRRQDHIPPNQHIYDNTTAVRFDLRRYWTLKVEGHFMDGYGSSSSDRGFYSIDNPNGKQAKTNMLVVRTGIYF